MFFSIILFLSLASVSPASPIDDLFTLLDKSLSLDSLYLPPNHTVQMASSYDRLGGDQDGKGCIRKEGDWFVIAEMQGPGAITRIWSMAPKGMIRIFIDDGASPKIQTAFQDIFQGKIKPFINPFVFADKKTRAHWSYIPIPYQRFCKIAISDLNYFQIEYVNLPFESQVKPFELPFPKKNDKKLSSIANRYKLSNTAPFKNGSHIEEYSIPHSIAAGEHIHLTTMEGPAIIRGLRMQWSGGEDAGRDLVLRAYWDNDEHPSILVPLHDFFGGGMRTLAIGQETSGWGYCYFPMPFYESARFVIENGSSNNSYNLEFVLYLEKKSIPSKHLRTFHAYWHRDNETMVRNLRWNQQRKEFLSKGEENYVALSVKGAGHLVAWGLDASPFPQSDVKLLTSSISGLPAFHGAGKYGFFDMAGSVSSTNRLFTAGKNKMPLSNGLFRLFLPAPIDFDEGAIVTLEHGKSNIKRKDYASTVFWYQENVERPRPVIFPPGARRFRTQPIEQPVIVLESTKKHFECQLEAETLPVKSVMGVYDPQDMLPYGPDWSGSQQINFDAFQPGGSLELTLPRQVYSGWNHLKCRLTSDPSGAIISMMVNQQFLSGKVDLYDRLKKPISINQKDAFFIHASDSPRIKFTVDDKHKNSSGYTVGVDSLMLVPTKKTPLSLKFQGTLVLPNDPDRKAPYPIKTLDGDHLLLGFNNAASPKINEQVILLDKKSQRFNIGEFLVTGNMPKGLCFLTWDIDVKQAGIYRFDINPAEIVPFLFREDSDSIILLKNRLLINNVLLTGKDVTRFDTENDSILPYRYSIPLQKGKNKLSWLMQCDESTWIQPVIYGLEREDSF